MTTNERLLALEARVQELEERHAEIAPLVTQTRELVDEVKALVPRVKATTDEQEALGARLDTLAEVVAAHEDHLERFDNWRASLRRSMG